MPPLLVKLSCKGLYARRFGGVQLRNKNNTEYICIEQGFCYPWSCLIVFLVMMITRFKLTNVIGSPIQITIAAILCCDREIIAFPQPVAI